MGASLATGSSFHCIAGGNAMKLPHRRQFLRFAAGAAALPGVSRIARAQTYPSRPVHIVVALAPGGTTDVCARLMGQWLNERLGQPFIIENRSGAGGNLGAEAVVRAPSDGYTLLGFAATSAINATLYENLSFNFIRDIALIAGLARGPNLMLVHPSFPAKSVPDFITYAKANPGRIGFGSAGIGSTLHLAGEQFNVLARVDMLHVPYRGGAAALTDLLGGQVQLMFGGAAESIEYIKTGKLRVLAVTSATRWDRLPDVPTVGEFLPGYEMSQWSGIGAPRDTSDAIVHKLNGEINAGLDDPKMKERLAAVGLAGWQLSPTELGKFVADETEKWARVIKLAGIKPV
jgi:tripartite-type tricarboxylate transporter receptor subunit TctC